ncbi:MAG: hypothetical protein MPW14_20260 [Candidatus Manganitrophus sp.]|nr:MAG: hypothetical protein MPW14_20260 [Candidatus Manganitrophus sp.]
MLTAEVPGPPPVWVADLTLTLHSPYHAPITAKGIFHQTGSKIRYEPAGSAEIDLYDLQEMEELRLFPADRIYFRAKLGPARILKAVREGWLPPPDSPGRETDIIKGGDHQRKGSAALFYYS